MIYIGLTGWGDHDSLYTPGTSIRDRLSEYAAHFPIVELDSSFYAIQPARNMEKWVKETQSSFQFIVKAYQGMTGHERGEIPFETKDEMFDAFIQSLYPLQHANKLAMVLFQFPPWFDCKKEHVEILRYCKEKMGDIPLALEFRHQSWFSARFYDKTLAFMEREGWIHSICDEPQIGEGSVPTVLHSTQLEKVLIRFHGRNKQGWLKPNGQNWREIRYLYRYNEKELTEWKKHIGSIAKQSEDVFIVFNNNSGGDAANNAKQFIELMNITYHDLAPRQLDLF